MENQNFTATFLVDQTPEEAFNAINQQCEWMVVRRNRRQYSKT